MKKISLLLFTVLSFATGTFAQVSVTATGGTPGPTPYLTLKAAFDAVNVGTHTGQININITAATVESATAQLNATGTGGASYTAITIAPTAAGISISASLAASLITFNGASNVTVNGNNNLTFVNTNTAGNTITFINDANKVAIKNTTIQGTTSSNLSGVVFFSTTTGTNGNDNNTLDGCNIDGLSQANICVESEGNSTTPTLQNSGDTLRNCKIYDNNQVTGSTYAVFLYAGNTDWYITGNNVYQTVTRTSSIQGLFYGIIVYPSYTTDQHFISGNFIGGNAPGGTGTMSLTSTTVALGFVGMDIETGGTLNVIQNNTIRNVTVTWALAGGSFPNSGIFTFINGFNGTSAITGNTITNLSFTNTAGSALGSGIVTNGRVAVAGTVTPLFTISNNTVSNITYNAGGTGSVQFMGLRLENSSTGGLTSTSTANTNFNVSGNTITNITTPSNGPSTWLRGIGTVNSQGTSPAPTSTAFLWPKATITNNTINTFSCASTVGSTAVADSVPVCVGIFFSTGSALTPGNSTDNQIISQNVISNLTSTDVTNIGNIVTGIHATRGIYTITRNRIYDLKNKAVATTANPALLGINMRGALGTTQIANNFVSLGTGENTNLMIFGVLNNFSALSPINVHFNSLVVTGTGDGTNNKTTAAFFRGSLALGVITTTVDVRDNLLINTRTGGSANFAIGNIYTTAPTGFTSNYNDLYSSNSATIGLWGATAYDFANWKLTTGQDANSVSVPVPFTNVATGDLHLTADPGLNGTPIAGITIDYDAQTRNAITPRMGADEVLAGLPVTLNYFNAKRNGTVNDLTWSTSQEINSSSFVIERSTDGRSFAPIGLVAAAGNSSTLRNYRFSDASPFKGINYYRIKMVDRDNFTRYSDIRNLRNNGRTDLTIYPNPVKDVMKVEINSDKAGNGSLIISDLNGKQVYSRTVNVAAGTNSFNVDLSGMAKGGYIIKIRLSEETIVRKISKM